MLLESVDHRVTEANLPFHSCYNKTNAESDALSRDTLGESGAPIKTSHTYLQVPDAARNIERTVRTFPEHPEWIVLDGNP
jgi:hypothetical protein